MLALNTAASLDATAATDQVRGLRRASAGRRPGRGDTASGPGGVPVGAGWVIRGDYDDGGTPVLVAAHRGGEHVELARAEYDTGGGVLDRIKDLLTPDNPGDKPRDNPDDNQSDKTPDNPHDKPGDKPGGDEGREGGD